MRLQGNKQDRCQLWVAALCREKGVQWRIIAVLGGKTAKVWRFLGCFISLTACGVKNIFHRTPHSSLYLLSFGVKQN